MKKKTLFAFVTLLMIALVATCTPAFAEEAEWEVANNRFSCTFMCVNEDGYTVSIVLKPSWLGLGMRATVVDGSVDVFTLTAVTAIRQAEKGVEVDWADIENPSTMTILNAQIKEVVF